VSIELVHRLRTCAAAIASSADGGNPWDVALIANDAADLLLEASNMLDVPAELGKPMEVIQATQPKPQAAAWGDQLNIEPRPCPSCGAITARTVRREGRKLMIICPCSATWEYGT
jgi:hypothetical protein